MKKLILLTAIAITLLATSVNAQTISSEGKSINLSKNQIAWIISHCPNQAARLRLVLVSGANIANNDTADLIMAFAKRMPKTVR